MMHYEWCIFTGSFNRIACLYIEQRLTSTIHVVLGVCEVFSCRGLEKFEHRSDNSENTIMILKHSLANPLMCLFLFDVLMLFLTTQYLVSRHIRRF